MSEQWVDIVPPAAPVTALDPLVIALLAALLGLLIGLAVAISRRPRSRARRALRRLARELQAARIEAKPACLQIRQCLRSGLGHSRLQSVRWHSERQGDWLAYVDRLSHHCFAPQSPSGAELDGLVREALGWLRRRAGER